MPPLPNPSERASSAEYLKESGLLMAAISSLVDRLETSQIHPDDEESFSFSSFDTPFTVPDSIEKAIGPSESAVVTYGRKPEPSISIELHGNNKTYYLTRYPDTVDTPTDAVVDVPYVDEVDRSFMNEGELRRATKNREKDPLFEKRIANIPGILHEEFVELLMRLSYPNILPDTLSDEERAKLSDTDVFDPEIFEQFVDASRVPTFSHTGTFDYDFLSSDEAHLTYFYEQEQPAAFEFACIDELTKLPLKFRGAISSGFTLESPVHAEAFGLNNEIVDTTRDFPLSLREIKYIRQLIQDEIELFPTPSEDTPESILDPDSVATSTNVLDVSEGKIDAQEETRQHVADMELEDDLYRLLHDDNSEE